MRKVEDTYKEVRVFEYPNMVVKVHIPDLTEEERARRRKAMAKAAEALVKDAWKQKQLKERGEQNEQ